MRDKITLKSGRWEFLHFSIFFSKLGCFMSLKASIFLKIQR
ncbi:hypothetical protein LEP1GSC168_1642 [Leptospira santarosai str. HAI134]|nr:hypothetical protein LEP1GSC168_1642 [Leptospira santarosai str. HAI134]